MSQSASSNAVAEALSSDHQLGSREDWWYDDLHGDTDIDTEPLAIGEVDRPDPNNPAGIIAHAILRETATILCGESLDGEPYLDNVGDLAHDQRKVAEAFAALDGERYGEYATHDENEEVELTDPTIRLGNTAPESTLVGEWGVERYRKRINPQTGYITGNETTYVAIKKRPLPKIMAVIEGWLRGVAARDDSGLTESEIQDLLDLARSLKKNQHQNKKDDFDIVEKVVERVRQ